MRTFDKHGDPVVHPGSRPKEIHLTVNIASSRQDLERETIVGEEFAVVNAIFNVTRTVDGATLQWRVMSEGQNVVITSEEVNFNSSYNASHISNPPP